MASGKKNYFRHNFNARKDDKIMELIVNHGKEAYFHFFALVEMCSAMASEGFPEDGKFVFHRRTLCAELLVTNSRLTHHLLAIQSSLLCQYFVTPSKVEILLPNLAKYMGKYDTKISPNVSNKRKEKKIKENKIKEEGEICGDVLHTDLLLVENVVGCVKKDKQDKPDLEFKANAIAESWNTMARENKLSCVKLPLSKDRVMLLKAAISEFGSSEDWDDIIWQVPRVKWNLGANTSGWRANFDWLVQKTSFNYRKMWEGAKRDGLSYIDEENGNGQHDAEREE